MTNNVIYRKYKCSNTKALDKNIRQNIQLY